MARFPCSRSALALLIALAGDPDAAAFAASADPPSVRATRTADTIRLDGHLDEAAWEAAEPIRPLTQQDPDEGGAPTETTDIRVLYDRDALYVGITCYDRSPGEIVSTLLTRDADLTADDLVTIVIDPFLDHRNGYFFRVNPAGARADGQISNNAEELTLEWDGIWDAAARTTAQGWQAEIVIPFKTLRFKPGQTTWGFNVERQIKRRNETDRWAGARLNVWLGNLTEAGRLSGIVDPGQGLGLDLRPYGSGGEENSDGKATGGLDLFKSLGPNLNAAITVNTDFAETEADIRQVNLTRFPLLFPEKRAFFLEGAGVFDIAGLEYAEDLKPFFSRRIGLAGTGGDETTVPIAAGAKITGRQADYNIGFLDVGTRRADGSPLGGQNLMALRVSRNLFEQSWIGGIVTSGNPAGTGSNTLVGADARFATSHFRGGKNLALELYGFRTSDGASGKQDTAGGFRIDYPNDVWDLSLNWKQIGRDFNAALGFVPRAGIRKSEVGVAFQPRPGRWGIYQLSFAANPTYTTNLHNRVENWDMYSSPFGIETDSGDRFESFYMPLFERLDEPFEISPGVVVPPGSYRWARYGAEGTTATKRPWVVEFEWSEGGLYAGTRRELILGFTLKPNTHLAISARSELNDVKLPQGAFTAELFTLRADYNLTPDVSWANLLQYDNASRIAGVQSRFRWILQPGNDLFIVVNRGWYRTFDQAWRPEFDRGSLKFQYTFRL